MKQIINLFKVKVVREQGEDPLTGEVLTRAEEDMTIQAVSPQAAYDIAQMMTSLTFRGQRMIVYVDGVEHRDERF